MVYFLKERATQIQELAVILAEAEHLTRKMVIFNGIERSGLLYFSFAMLSLFLKPIFCQVFSLGRWFAIDLAQLCSFGINRDR